MKTVVILYGGDLTHHAFDKVFGGKSAFESVLEWAALFSEKIILFTKNSSSLSSQISSILASYPKVGLVSKDSWSKADFIAQIASSLKENSAESALVSYADTPFLNEKLTRDLLEMHEKYAAEYSFADGFPYGLTPELIEAGTASILSELAKTTLKSEGEKPVDREAIFSVMRGDINSFEIETLISDVDYRLLRFNFDTASKINFTACKNLYEQAIKQNVSLSDAYALSNLASKTPSVMQTLPAFYNIQITSKFNHKSCYSLSSVNKNPAPRDFMAISDFNKILSQIKEFSEDAVISISAFGEPLLHPDFLQIVDQVINQNDQNHKISLLIETDGLLVSQEISSKIASLAALKNARVDWIVYIDAIEPLMYSKIHSCDQSDFEKALKTVPLLEKDFPHHVYPQFMRLKTNEEQLEGFYRYWKEKDSPSQGELIIQKYNSVCGILPDLKSADLSPVNRLPCWHLRRDMTILSDGSVPVCFQLLDEISSNVISDGIEAAWQSVARKFETQASCQNLPHNCGICDESYTFNF